MITAFDQWKTPSGHWVVIIHTKDNMPHPYNNRPYGWWEADGEGEKGLARQIRAASR